MMSARPDSFYHSDEGLSESIGYILIVGILMVSLGLIYAVGYPQLDSSIDEGHFKNMENGFIIMNENINRVSTNHAPGQSVELKLRGGVLYTEVSGLMNITLTFSNGTTVQESYEKMTVLYSFNGNMIGTECGGVMERYGSNMYVLRNPGIIEGDPYIIPVDMLWGTPSSVAGEGLAKVSIYGSSPTVRQYDDIIEINITVQSEFYKAWVNYFRDSLRMTSSYDEETKTAIGVYKPASPLEVITVTKSLCITING